MFSGGANERGGGAVRATIREGHAADTAAAAAGLSAATAADTALRSPSGSSADGPGASEVEISTTWVAGC